MNITQSFSFLNKLTNNNINNKIFEINNNNNLNKKNFFVGKNKVSYSQEKKLNDKIKKFFK